jgi:predicted DNA-binding protein YlxM (UPF0122 family)
MENNFQPVKDYAALKQITVQAVYDKIKKQKVLVKKIGTYTLVCDK